MGITKKQMEVYDYINSYTHEYGYAPTQKEIKEHFGFKSFGSVQRYIRYLSNAGYLECDWNARRGLKTLPNPLTGTMLGHNSASEVEIPLLGRVAAGNPILALENPTETIGVPPSMVMKKNQKYFALKVKGDSMIEDGIFEDDVIICKVQNSANQGQTVVAIIDEEATVKRFYKKQSAIELHPANSAMKPIKINSGDFRLAGVLVGLIRTYV